MYRETQFTLTIDLGNDAMCSPQDVAEALRDVARKLDREPTQCTVYAENIRDVNGNTVGMFAYDNCAGAVKR